MGSSLSSKFEQRYGGSIDVPVWLVEEGFVKETPGQIRCVGLKC